MKKVLVSITEVYTKQYCIGVEGNLTKEQVLDQLEEDYSNGLLPVNPVEDSGRNAAEVTLTIKGEAKDQEPVYNIGTDPESVIHEVTITEGAGNAERKTVVYRGTGEAGYDKCMSIVEMLGDYPRVKYESYSDHPEEWNFGFAELFDSEEKK